MGPSIKAFLSKEDCAIGTTPTTIALSESRGWFSRRDSTPFAILSFRLETTQDIGSPAQIIRHHVLGYFADDTAQENKFKYFDLPFSFPTKVSVKNFTKEIESLVQTLEKFVLARPCSFNPLTLCSVPRFVVFWCS